MPWDQYPYLEAIPTFGRAMGALHTGDFAKAQAAIDRLETLEEKAASLNIAYDWGIQVRIQKTAAKAWLLYEQGEKDRALDSMKKRGGHGAFDGEEPGEAG